MAKPASTSKTSCKQYTPEFRDEALKLAERIGVAATARELGLYESQRYNWRNKQQQQMTSSESENELAVENARLKRQLAERDEELACDALQMALWRRKQPKSVIVHTDRGGQYCSADYQSLLKRHCKYPGKPNHSLLEIFRHTDYVP
ncbi:transposase-like protein [Erwinia sp. AG740]|nr:transposase-like protein [Erwinia sp. AG740]